MILHSIRLKDFRGHAAADFNFGSGVNLICGANGIGKTNILEAIHFLSLTKGFLTSSDLILLRRGASFFELEGSFSGLRRTHLKVRAAFARGEGKKLFVNGSEVERKSDHIGSIPVVLLCPQDQALTAGPPSERRRFLDNIISQSSATYLQDLFRYRRALRQRNEVLQRQRRTGHSGESNLLEPWTKELVDIGSRIIVTRARFCDVFSEQLQAAHEKLGDLVERPKMAYSTIDPLPADVTREDVQALFGRRLSDLARMELKRGVTMAGPHRDDLVFKLNDLNVRRYASQGQHRTFGMALKLAQYRYLLEATEEPPILLLDDVFDNLDENRIALFLRILREEGMGQTIITAARRDILDRFLEFGDENVHLLELPATSQNKHTAVQV